MSEKFLDLVEYDDNSNNYKNSSIRKWLNGGFLNKAFSDDSLIATTEVNNSTASTCQNTNPYVCENTNDKIFLLSRQDMLNEDYFTDKDSRIRLIIVSCFCINEFFKTWKIEHEFSSCWRDKNPFLDEAIPVTREIFFLRSRSF